MNKNIFYEAIKELQFIVKEHDISRIEKALKLGMLYEELSNYVDEQTYAHELPKITQLKILIKELENE